MIRFFSRSRWSFFDKVAGFVSLSILVSWLVLPVIGKASGQIWPVVTPIVFENYSNEPPPEYRNLWRGSAYKNRDCDFVGVNWYLGKRGGRRTSVFATFLDPPRINKAGQTLTWDRLVINLEPHEVVLNSFSDVVHQCYLIDHDAFRVPYPWLTFTEYYDSRPEDVAILSLDHSAEAEALRRALEEPAK